MINSKIGCRQSTTYRNCRHLALANIGLRNLKSLLVDHLSHIRPLFIENSAVKSNRFSSLLTDHLPYAASLHGKIWWSLTTNFAVLQGGDDTGKTGNVDYMSFRQRKHREFD